MSREGECTECLMTFHEDDEPYFAYGQAFCSLQCVERFEEEVNFWKSRVRQMRQTSDGQPREDER